MPQRFRDTFGNERRSLYDAYCLLSSRAVDAVGNQTTAVHDYRVLQPMRVSDPNNNSSAAAFDERGLVVATAIAGAAGEGDDLQGLIPDLTRAELDAFFADPVAHAPALLGNATTRIVRDLERTPSYEATIRRDRHGTPSTISLAFTYVDGFGRAVQTKQQTETARWIASGSTVFNNKGKPVEQYEPFFDDTHVFRPATQVGVSATTFYDPAERVVATLRPDHAWNKTVVDPWRSETWDFNDTVAIADPKSDPDVGAYFARLADVKYLPTWHGARAAGQLGPAEQEAAEKTAKHAGTPSITCADALGRTVLAIGHNRFERGGTTIDEHGATRFALDITGNIRSVTDASERVVIRNEFDMLDRRIHCVHLDAAERWLFCDVGGFAIAAWDSRDHRVRTTYDAASRPLETFLARGTEPEIVVGRMVYGETEPAATNARGRAVRAFDQAGVVETAHYDFKGNALASVRRLTRSYRETIDWSADPALETESFTTRFEYDAQNRVVAKIAPDGSVERRTRNLAGQLAHLDLALGGAPVPIVSTVEYNARGQRTRIVYGNTVTSTYRYDPETFRTTHCETTRADLARLQRVESTYDPGGRITSLRDDAQATIYFNNQVVSADADFTYDALYQLVRARGREHIGQVPQTTWNDQFRTNHAHPSDGAAMRRYDEAYGYDLAGNLRELVHRAGGGDWTRRYEYGPGNRTLQTQVGATVEAYGYDAHGNTTAMPHVPVLAWSFRDQLQRAELGGGGTAFYVYDGQGRRIRKVVEKNNGALVEDRIDLDGFEVFRRSTGDTVTFERETVHVIGDEGRVALVETQTRANGAPIPRVPRFRYQCPDRLGSAALELDASGLVISYEEYYPFGGTAYQAVRSEADQPKRYRHAAKERDEETGFTYFGARYAAPWLGRWIACDPAVIDGTPSVAFDQSAYALCSNDPVNRVDPDGRVDYLNNEGEFVGNDGRANDNDFLLLMDAKDVSMVRDRYMGSWWQRNKVGVIGAIVGLLIGLAAGLLCGGAWWALLLLAPAGYGAGRWLSDGRPKQVTARSALNEAMVVEGPPIEVRQAARDAERRSDRASTPDPSGMTFMDSVGGQHEEGGIWGTARDGSGAPAGSLVIGQARPGRWQDPFIKGIAPINVFDLVSPIPAHDVVGTFHVHPQAHEERPGKNPGETEFGEYEQLPSTADVANVTERMQRADVTTRQSGYSFVVGSRSNEVYFYDQRNAGGGPTYFAKIPSSRFYKGTH
jgi:RHS repeat-associated protein